MLGDTSISRLEQALNQASLNQKVIAQNIANVDTPNYKAQEVSFSNVLSDSIQAIRTDSRQFEFSNSTPQVITDPNAVMQNNGNTVDIDQQMVNLANNQLNYQAYADAISRKFNMYNTVLGG